MRIARLTVILSFGIICLVAMFAQPSPSLSPQTGIEGTITIGPTHGGPSRVGVSNSRPLANTDFVVQDHKGEQVASFKTDDQGHFRVVLTPGHYKVSRSSKQKVGFFGPFETDVTAGQLTKVEWQCDSGMR